MQGYRHEFVNHTKKEYARGDVHENRTECLFSLLKPYLRVFRGLSKTNLLGYVGFFQFLRNFRQQNAFEQAEMIIRAALDPTIASKARREAFVKCLDHFDLLQTPIKCQTQMLDALVAFLQGDHIRHGFLAAIVAAHDELKFDTHGEAPPVR